MLFSTFSLLPLTITLSIIAPIISSLHPPTSLWFSVLPRKSSLIYSSRNLNALTGLTVDTSSNMNINSQVSQQQQTLIYPIVINILFLLFFHVFIPADMWHIRYLLWFHLFVEPTEINFCINHHCINHGINYHHRHPHRPSNHSYKVASVVPVAKASV